MAGEATATMVGMVGWPLVIMAEGAEGETTVEGTETAAKDGDQVKKDEKGKDAATGDKKSDDKKPAEKKPAEKK